jgi:hypothetical protein
LGSCGVGDAGGSRLRLFCLSMCKIYVPSGSKEILRNPIIRLFAFAGTVGVNTIWIVSRHVVESENVSTSTAPSSIWNARMDWSDAGFDQNNPDGLLRPFRSRTVRACSRLSPIVIVVVSVWLRSSVCAATVPMPRISVTSMREAMYRKCAMSLSFCGVTAGFSKPEQLTPRKSKRPIGGFAYTPLFVSYCSVRCGDNTLWSNCGPSR